MKILGKTIQFTIQLNNAYITDIHVIAAIKADETYENLKVGFGDAIKTINSLIQVPVLLVQDELYELEFFFVSDYKVSYVLTVCKPSLKKEPLSLSTFQTLRAYNILSVLSLIVILLTIR